MAAATTLGYRSIAQMPWEARLRDHKRVFGELGHHEAHKHNQAHVLAAVHLGAGKDADNLTPDQAAPLKVVADTRNNATTTNADNAATAVKAIDTTSGDEQSWVDKMNAARDKQKAADAAATDKAYDDAIAHIKTLPSPEAQQAASNVFIKAMSWVSDAYNAVTKALSDAFASVVKAINVAIQAVEDAAKAAVHWVEGAASSVANFFENLF